MQIRHISLLASCLFACSGHSRPAEAPSGKAQGETESTGKQMQTASLSKNAEHKTPSTEVWRFLPATVRNITILDIGRIVSHPLFEGDVVAALGALQTEFEPSGLNLLGDLIECEVDLSSKLREFAFGQPNAPLEEDSELFTIMAGISRDDVEQCLTTLQQDQENDGQLLRHSEDWYAWIDDETVLVGSGALLGQGGMDKAIARRLLNADQQVIANDTMRTAIEALDRGASARYLSFKKDDSPEVSCEIHFADEVKGWVRYDLTGAPEFVERWLNAGLGKPSAEKQSVIWRTDHLPDDKARVGLLLSVLDAISYF